MRNKKVFYLVLIGVLTALTTAATYIGVPWPLATGGYVHLGTLVSLVIALSLGKKIGAITGGFGMAIFDVFSPWVVWAPGTFIARLIVGYVVGLISYDRGNGTQGTNVLLNVLAILVGGFIYMVLFYFYEAIFLTDFNAAFASIYGNLTQFTIGLIALAVVPGVNYIKRQFDI
jgi:uncharacterized membrane protein